ncbi:SGNH/GDSL hydrolase family protein [Demequina litorisediminis]|uniref:SGNH hydrolase n=1 Tax=Demequina litorisediminis TaxID=1849022 RepID=A0ABQ6IC44_9MICO|nr:SGNH/GDSL hydrolase family protein [Demequina litorisediminis]GMA34308.1 SGNH hydrolase [Demequina litorisediminis]
MTGPRVVAMGDSITLGVGDGIESQWGSVGWAALVATALGASAFTNLAANGVRARDLAAQVSRVERLRPDIVLLTVGGNDALRGDFDADEVETATRDALTALTSSPARVVVVTIDRIGLFDLLPRGIARAMARRAQAVNTALRRAAATTDVTVLDGSVIFAIEGAAAWHIDRIHPSPRGHRALASAAVASLAARWPRTAAIPAPARTPSRVARVWWLARHGAPWAAKRSRDLLPQVVRSVISEVRSPTASAPHTPTAGRP